MVKQAVTSRVSPSTTKNNEFGIQTQESPAHVLEDENRELLRIGAQAPGQASIAPRNCSPQTSGFAFIPVLRLDHFRSCGTSESDVTLRTTLL